MEKFRSTSDPSTGVHPFLPPVQPRTFLSYAWRCVLILLRAPVFLVVSVLYAAVSSLIQVIPIPAISRILERTADIVFLLPLAMSLGLCRYHPPLLEKPRARGVSAEARPTAGDIIVVNHASPLDALYLGLCYSPVFAIPCGVAFILLSTPSAFWHVGCAPTFRGRTMSLKALMATKKRAPVVIFAEGCTTNSRGVLDFDLSADSLVSSGSLFALGLRYSADRREAFTVGSFWKHLFHMMASPSCRILGHLQALPPSSPNLQRAVAYLAGVPALRIGREAGLRFSAHWDDQDS